MLKKSPSGSLCPYYYMGGELHPLKYGSFFTDKSKLFNIISAEQEFILNSSGIKNRRIWIDLYETTIDDEIIDKLVFHIQAINNKIYKLCLVGCNKKDFKTIKNKLGLLNIDIATQIKCFSDPEEAKQWLIGKLIL